MRLKCRKKIPQVETRECREQRRIFGVGGLKFKTGNNSFGRSPANKLEVNFVPFNDSCNVAEPSLSSWKIFETIESFRVSWTFVTIYAYVTNLGKIGELADGDYNTRTQRDIRDTRA